MITEGRSGSVGFVGRPNAGKSTLMNRILREKIAIVSDKPQTTRHRLVGILTDEHGQMVIIDTPGVHKPRHRMNRRMVKIAVQALTEVDLVCLLADAATAFGSGDRYMLSLLGQLARRPILALNKVDVVSKPKLLPLIERYAEADLFDEIVPISALHGDGVDLLVDLIWQRLPIGPPMYDVELSTVHPERFLVAERIREKVLHNTREELPFSTAVLITGWDEDADTGFVSIRAEILVEKDSQRRILIGRGGQMIKKIGTLARADLEAFLEHRIFLDLHVRSEPGWREKTHILAELDRQPWSAS